MTETALRISRGIFRFLLPILAFGQVSAEPSSVGCDQAELDIRIEPNGATANAGWALGRLNKGASFTNSSFVYPDTTVPVRLYLIDSGVAHAGTWFAKNKNLKSFRSELIRAVGDPTTSTVVTHGTQMLSLIAGPETGAALGTPLHVVNLNIYPGSDGTTTTLGRLQKAVYRAIDDHEANPGMPSVICIANSSVSQVASGGLESAVDEAIQAGITVVVSAGNQKAKASNYIPSAYGTKPGVICTGATGSDNLLWEDGSLGTNTGAAVDLYAPGQNVRTINPANPQSGNYVAASGTSPASALTAAAALIQLSLNPALKPAEVELALTSTGYAAVAEQSSPNGVTVPKALVQVLPDPEGDSDLDGISDIIENFSGSNAASAASMPAPMALARVSGEARITFAVSSDLFDPASPYDLRDGSKWKVQISENLADWEVATGTLTPGEVVEGVIPVTFSVPNTSAKVFLRIDVTPPPTQP